MRSRSANTPHLSSHHEGVLRKNHGDKRLKHIPPAGQVSTKVPGPEREGSVSSAVPNANMGASKAPAKKATENRQGSGNENLSSEPAGTPPQCWKRSCGGLPPTRSDSSQSKPHCTGTWAERKEGAKDRKATVQETPSPHSRLPQCADASEAARCQC